MPEVQLDHALIEIDQHAATACDPTQEPVDHVETSPNAMANEAVSVSHETRRVALDKLNRGSWSSSWPRSDRAARP